MSANIGKCQQILTNFIKGWQTTTCDNKQTMTKNASTYKYFVLKAHTNVLSNKTPGNLQVEVVLDRHIMGLKDML
jgi:hypothetical protein